MLARHYMHLKNEKPIYYAMALVPLAFVIILLFSLFPDFVSTTLPSRSQGASSRKQLGHFFLAGRIVRTGQLARATTLAVTLPSMICSMPVRPWVDITIKSAFSSSVFLTILL